MFIPAQGPRNKSENVDFGIGKSLAITAQSATNVSGIVNDLNVQLESIGCTQPVNPDKVGGPDGEVYPGSISFHLIVGRSVYALFLRGESEATTVPTFTDTIEEIVSDLAQTQWNSDSMEAHRARTKMFSKNGRSILMLMSGLSVVTPSLYEYDMGNAAADARDAGRGLLDELWAIDDSDAIARLAYTVRETMSEAGIKGMGSFIDAWLRHRSTGKRLSDSGSTWMKTGRKLGLD